MSPTNPYPGGDVSLYRVGVLYALWVDWHCSRCDLNTMSYPFICPGHPAPERSDEAPKYRWRVQFISTPEDGVEEEMGRYDFADETEARPAFERYGAEYRDLEFWRVELRRQQVSDWETVEDTGYAAPVDGETTNA